MTNMDAYFDFIGRGATFLIAISVLVIMMILPDFNRHHAGKSIEYRIKELITTYLTLYGHMVLMLVILVFVVWFYRHLQINVNLP